MAKHWPYITYQMTTMGFLTYSHHSSTCISGTLKTSLSMAFKLIQYLRLNFESVSGNGSLGLFESIWRFWEPKCWNAQFLPLTWPWHDTWPFSRPIFMSALEPSRRDLSNAASPVLLAKLYQFRSEPGRGVMRPPPQVRSQFGWNPGQERVLVKNGVVVYVGRTRTHLPGLNSVGLHSFLPFPTSQHCFSEVVPQSPSLSQVAGKIRKWQSTGLSRHIGYYIIWNATRRGVSISGGGVRKRYLPNSLHHGCICSQLLMQKKQQFEIWQCSETDWHACIVSRLKPPPLPQMVGVPLPKYWTYR